MVEPRRLYERIARKLAKAIASGEYEIGQRLPSERELAQTFEVSRPTVREAIIALELDELVEVRLGSGVYVVNRHPPSGHEGVMDIGPFELLEARRAIEGEAAALAALRIEDAQLEELANLVQEMSDDNRVNEIRMSEEVLEATLAMRTFLFAAVYENETATAEFKKAAGILGGLWERVRERPGEFLDPRILEADGVDTAAKDFVAGMTDRFAVALYERLFIPRPWVGPLAWT